MNRLLNPWPDRTWRDSVPRPHRIPEVRTVRLGDVDEARRLMRGDYGAPLSLRDAAQQLGVLASDLDLALWRGIGGGL